jgi:TonB family protein
VVYPAEARSRGITGVTRIRFEIAEDGRAEKIRTVATSGSALLDAAADAGELPRVYGRVEVPIRFELLRRHR